jgi:nitrogenase subunit NifH
MTGAEPVDPAEIVVAGRCGIHSLEAGGPQPGAPY